MGAMNFENVNKSDLIKKGLLALASLALISCAQDKGAVSMSSSYQGARGQNAGLNSAGANIPTTGVIYTDAANQNAYQAAVAGLVSTDLPESSLDYVSAQWENGTGVAFGGRVTLANGGAIGTSAGWGQQTISSSSQILIVVQHANQATVGQPRLYFKRASGVVSGTAATIQFSDDYGLVTLQGTFVSNRFRGTISFDNAVKYDGTRPGAAGTLGAFDIAACDFFKCY
jgi:hypothetical protein